MKLLIRIIISIIIAVSLASIGVSGNSTVLRTLFTVLCIIFSISVSFLVSFSLSKVLNKKVRKKLQSNIEHSRNMLLFDFSISIIVLFIALRCNERYLRYTFGKVTIDIILIAIVLIGFSLIYEAYNFRKLHKLNTDIENAIMDEEVKKNKKIL